MRSLKPDGLPDTVVGRGSTAPPSPRPPGRPGRPAVLSRPASWPGSDPYRPRRQGQASRLFRLRGPLITLLRRAVVHGAFPGVGVGPPGALLRRAVAWTGGALPHLALDTVTARPKPAVSARWP